ncbi:MAG: thermitase [Acidimicrobiaceae bacterium]
MGLKGQAARTAPRTVPWPRVAMLGLLFGCFAAFLPVVPAAADTAPVLVTFESQAAANAGANETVLDGAESMGAGVLSVDANAADAAAIARLPGVLGVEADVAYHAADLPLPSTPSDPCLIAAATCGGLLSGYVDQIGLRQLWAKTHGASVTLAVLDGGVDPSNADLASKLIGTEVDMTDVHDGPSDHGTSVASIAVASADNRIGLAGVGWDVRLLSVKVLDSTGTGRLSDVAAGVVAATDRGASVLNLSLSGPFTLALANAVDYAVSHGVIVVAAAGNQASDDPPNAGYPARYPGVVAVGATTALDTVAPFSNFGSWVDVFAPGVGLPAWQLSGTIKSFSGTSAASPVVAGVAALLKAGTPSLTSEEMSALLHDTGRRLGSAQHDASRLDAAVAAAAPGLFPAAPNSPAGALDTISRVPGGITVRGWAIDRGATDAIPVHAYVDGVGVQHMVADRSRPDVAFANPGYGADHGYEATLPVEGGVHTVCTYGINGGAGGNALLDCRQLEVSSRAYGSLDVVNRTASGVTVSGWAIDPARWTPTSVSISIDGGDAGTFVANAARSDVGDTYPAYGPVHGFTIAARSLGDGAHLVCVTALNAAAARTPLGCRSV